MKLCAFLALVVSAASASDDLVALPGAGSSVLATGNLLDSGDFFVCGSKVPGMNGHYVLQPPDVVQSDPDTPVFFREDDDSAPQSTDVALASDAASDFRLFRHNGFWMLADVEPWPPVTHFRCDPTKSQVVGVDVSEVCGLGQSTPPRLGYSAADRTLGDASLVLHRRACKDQQEIESQARLSSYNVSTRKEEL
jgi:hypothetical protein